MDEALKMEREDLEISGGRKLYRYTFTLTPAEDAGGDETADQADFLPEGRGSKDPIPKNGGDQIGG